jgi:predicted nucleic acid-binding protein
VILVDTSVWVDHLHSGDPGMSRLLETRQVLAHDFVVGELAMGRLTDRQAVMLALENLSYAQTATHEEVLSLIERHRLYGTGIGFVDAHILASAMLSTGCKLWTRDKRLNAQAQRFGLVARDLD